MDIDFHFHATFVAARFAGYTWEQAKIIGTAAQMIDENGYGAVADEIPIRKDDSQELSGFVFKPLPTFAGIGTIGGMWANPIRSAKSKEDEHASIWSVFHFLPGNFDLRSTIPASFRSDRWVRREWGQAGKAAPKAFGWLCRPHSPMAIELIRNCRELVNDPASQVNQAGAALHFVGVTMHVFADTFAHQDHAGLPSQEVNDARGDTFYQYAETAEVVRPFVPEFVPDEEKWQAAAWKWNLFGSKEYPPRGPNVSYVGHGRVGHWPDHSALVYKYHPSWSGKHIVRNNPMTYYDAFLHLVLALMSIRNNEPYVPIDLTEANVNAVFAKTAAGGAEVPLTKAKLDKVFELIRGKREALPRVQSWNGVGHIDDPWDQAIAVHGNKWRKVMKDDLGVGDSVETWLPGHCLWLDQARGAKDKKGRVEATVVRNLDYFKFNYAAKIHYRSVKERLLAWGETLIGEWSDGSAYLDDVALLKSNPDGDKWREKARQVLALCAKTTKKQYRQQGLVLLMGELDTKECKTEQQLVGRLYLALSDAGEPVYTLRHTDGGNTITQIKKLIGELGAADGVTPMLQFGVMPSLREFKEELTYERFGRRASDVILTAIDTALQQFDVARGEEAKMPFALEVQAKCIAWLDASYTQKTVSRGAGVNTMKLAVTAWLADYDRAHPQRARSVGSAEAPRRV